MRLNDGDTIRRLGSTTIKENAAIMNLRQTLRAASIFATLFCFWMQPAAAQQEIKLTKSITMLPDRPSGIEMIFKSWHNVYAEFVDPDRFILTFLTGADRRREPGKYYEHVLAFASGKPVKFSIQENSGECSEEQTMVFRVPSRRGPRLVVGTADEPCKLRSRKAKTETCLLNLTRRYSASVSMFRSPPRRILANPRSGSMPSPRQSLRKPCVAMRTFAKQSGSS